MFTIHISNKSLESRKYKGLLLISNKTINNLIKMDKTLKQTLYKRRYMIGQEADEKVLNILRICK